MESWIVTAVVVAVMLLVLAIAAVAFVGVVTWLLRGRGVDPAAARAEGLKNLGYSGLPDGTWVYPIQGTQMVFEERPTGLRWQLRLPRYNTMTLALAEVSSGRTVEGAFESGIYAIDQRFVLGSPQADRIVALLKQPKLQKALLRMPNLALELSADELVLEDPGKAGLATLDGADPVEAELTEHALVINVVNGLFGSLYAESGTVLEQFR